MMPRATYRIQFRNGFGFDEAVAIVPYLASLGVSHLYASPIFSATSGSTHGYDITDHNVIDPQIGGREGFGRLVEALKQAGLGLILDIVPNHMAASMENPWWRSVVELGRNSPYARHFDIDWREPLTLPVLGKPFDEAVDAGEITLAQEAGEPVFAYFDNHFPLHPDSVPAVGDAGGIAAASADKAFLRRLHEMQPYRLNFWKDARRHLSYRRFFEVTGLVGVRVEDDAVFDDVHRLILELVRSGAVDGLRVDHVDGLADPKGYLERLRAEIGPDVWLGVEKILNGKERLAPDWPIEGTTGYEFTAAMADLLMDGDGTDALKHLYAQAAGRAIDIETERRVAKQLMVEKNFETEMTGLVRLAREAGVEGGDEALGEALAEIVKAFPVYRTYRDAGALRLEDAAIIDGALNDSRENTADPSIKHALGDLLKAEGGPAAAEEFRIRFQQLTGPVTAKAVEDTLFYRYNAVLALNEVGCDPAEPVGAVEHFHRRMIERRSDQPVGLSGTSTHDTKRGEDARARLYALSEAPDAWAGAVSRWRDINAASQRQHAPDRETEWLIYQALAGVWTTETRSNLDGLRERFLPYLEKALREAELRTSWTEQDNEYEAAVTAYVEALLSDGNAGFLDDFERTLWPFIAAGELNALSQLLVKLTAPGIPDIYQGTEIADLSLVDPDNRRPVDYSELEAMSGRIAFDWASAVEQGTAKLKLLRTGLALRADRPDLFANGIYQSLAIGGAKAGNAVSFMRSAGNAHCVVVAPRLPLRLFGQNVDWRDVSAWGDTSVSLPQSMKGLRLENRLTGEVFEPADGLLLSQLLKDCPVALLVDA